MQPHRLFIISQLPNTQQPRRQLPVEELGLAAHVTVRWQALKQRAYAVELVAAFIMTKVCHHGAQSWRFQHLHSNFV